MRIESLLQLALYVHNPHKEKIAQIEGPMRRHVLTLVNRHIASCESIGIAPDITNTFVAALEDFEHHERGFGVLGMVDRQPEGAENLRRSYDVYVEPVETRKRQADRPYARV
jgi:hypothetical protein